MHSPQRGVPGNLHTNRAANQPANCHDQIRPETGVAIGCGAMIKGWYGRNGYGKLSLVTGLRDYATISP